MSVEALKDENVVAGLDKSVFDSIGKTGSSEQKRAIKDTLLKMRNEVKRINAQPQSTADDIEKAMLYDEIENYITNHDYY